MMTIIHEEHEGHEGYEENYQSFSHSISSQTNDTEGRLPSNSIIDLKIFGPYVWAATGNGLASFDSNPNSPNPAAGIWTNFSPEHGLGDGGVSGLTLGITSWGDTIIWASTAVDYVDGDETYPAGGGVGFSVAFNDYTIGEHWVWFPQPVDPRDTQENQDLLDSLNIAKPTTTHVYNVTYDIAIVGDRVWIASYAGGLRYLDMDPPLIAMDNPDDALEQWHWVNAPPDMDNFDAVAHYNHRAFSVSVMSVGANRILWVGTAGGINKSMDNGATWQRYSHNPDTTIVSPGGNFITALGSQHLPSRGKYVLWAATWSTGGETEYYGVSLTEDFGNTWKRVLGSRSQPVKTHNFAFSGDTAYVATDDGLYVSPNFGESWALYPRIGDLDSLEFAYEREVYSVAVGRRRLWVGSPAGLAVTADRGVNWHLMRTFPMPETQGQPDTYAYPNPFSPERFEVVRMQYNLNQDAYITLEIYDFAMELLLRPVKSEWRPAGARNEVWNGHGPGGRKVANGVYFYRISGGGKDRWGKIMLLD